MRLLITLSSTRRQTLPINYQYPLSAAIYHILKKGDKGYAAFLHERGYGKGFKFFTFSQISCPFKIEGDRLRLLANELQFQIAFHLPEAAENFVKGLFQAEQIDIADKKSKASFRVQSVESLPNPLRGYKENEIVNIPLQPLSPVIAGLPDEKGNYEFLAPEDPRFIEVLIYNWREKIKACYDEVVAKNALLLLIPEIDFIKSAPKSRLMTIKADTPAETKIRGWVNFGLKVTGEKRLVELLVNAGAGVYNAQGMGCVGVVTQ